LRSIVAFSRDRRARNEGHIVRFLLDLLHIRECRRVVRRISPALVVFHDGLRGLESAHIQARFIPGSALLQDHVVLFSCGVVSLVVGQQRKALLLFLLVRIQPRDGTL